MNRDIETPGIENAAGPETHSSDDRLRRVVQGALAIYLLPALAVVMVVGGVMVVATEVTRLALRVAGVRTGASRFPAVAMPRRVKPPLVDRGTRIAADVGRNVPAVQRGRGPTMFH